MQILCGYVTLPLYALVTQVQHFHYLPYIDNKNILLIVNVVVDQMGSTMKEAVFTEKVVEGLKSWKSRARKNLKKRNHMSHHSLETSASFTVDIQEGDSSIREDHIAVDIQEQKRKAEGEGEAEEMNTFGGFDVRKTVSLDTK